MTGLKDNPTFKHLEALAGCFGVEPAYFFDDATAERVDADLASSAAMQAPDVRAIALAVSELSPDSLAMVLAVIERTRALEVNVGRRGANPSTPAKPSRKRTRKATTGDGTSQGSDSPGPHCLNSAAARRRGGGPYKQRWVLLLDGEMAKVYEDGIDLAMAGWLLAQPMFVVATAPPSADGHVNVSPKGMSGTFVVRSAWQVAYLDFTGSGAETIAQLRDNGRITLMFMSFEAAWCVPATPPSRSLGRSSVSRRPPVSGRSSWSTSHESLTPAATPCRSWSCWVSGNLGPKSWSPGERLLPRLLAPKERLEHRRAPGSPDRGRCLTCRGPVGPRRTPVSC